MKNKIAKSKLVLLNVESFGIDEDLNSKLNFYKFISLDNWKKLISFRNSSKIIEYKTKDSTYQNEFYNSFGFKNNINNNTFVDFTVQFQKIYRALQNKENQNSLNNIHIFLYINNNFVDFYLPIFANFLRQLNLFLFETKLKETNNNFFHLNLIIERPVNNIEHFDSKINSLLSNNFNCLIDSITIKNGFADEYYLKDQVEDYFNKVVLQKDSVTFYSIQDFLYENVIQKAAKDVVISKDFIHNKIAKNDLVLHFNFNYDMLNSLSKKFGELFVQNQIEVTNLSLKFNLKNTILNNISSEIFPLINKYEHKTIVIGKQNIPFYNKVFFGTNESNFINNYEFKNSYEYIYNSAKLFFESIDNNLKDNNIILANCNILTEAKKYFGFYEWLYALMVFDFYIYKITRLLDKNNARWTFFSTSFGFEKSFNLSEKDTITLPFLSNQFYSNIKGYSHANWEDFKASLFTLIKNTSKLSLRSSYTEKVKLSKYLFKQQKELSLIENSDDVLAYIKKWMPKINVGEYDAYINEANKDVNFINETFKVEKISWDKFILAARMRIDIHSTLRSMYIEEKEMFINKYFNDDELLYKLVMFYYQNNRVIRSFLDSKYAYKTSSKLSTSVSNAQKSINSFDPTSSYNAYTNHIINIQEAINANDDDELKETLDVKFFKDKFLEIQDDLRKIQLLRFNKFKDEEFRFNQAMILRNKKNELLLKKLKKWEILHDQINTQENADYQNDFDIEEGIKAKETKEDYTEVINIVEETKPDSIYTGETEDDF